MDIQRLKSAAKLAQKTRPDLAQEILRIAQELEQGFDPSVSMGFDPSADMDSQSTNPLNLNPNIDSKYVQPMADKKATHVIQLTVEVPENTDKTWLMNEVNRAVQSLFAEKGGGYNVKGYSFNERSAK